MNDPAIHETGVDALVAYVHEHSEARCQAILSEADDEVRRVVSRARTTANRAVREAIRLDRQRLDRQVQAEAVRRRLRRREQDQADIGRTLRALQPAVRKALADLWQDPACRARWIRNTLELAQRRLSRTEWSVRHPAGLDPAEMAKAWERPLRCAPDDGIETGLVVATAHARIDATPAGLTARSGHLQGLLLGRLTDSGHGDGDGA